MVFPKRIAVTVDANAEGPVADNLIAWADVKAADKGKVAIYELIEVVDAKEVTKVRRQGSKAWIEA